MSKLQKGRQAWLSRVTYRPDWRVLLPLAAATLLLLAGAFFGWQSWLVARESASSAHAVVLRTQQAEMIAEQLDKLTRRVEAVLQSAPVQDALRSDDAEGRAAAASAFLAAMPEAEGVSFHDARLDEVLKLDLRTFGYARAQMLLQAQALEAAAPAQMHGVRGKGQQLVLAMPVKSSGRIIAYASVQFPFAPVVDLFRSPGLSGARIDLRQGEGRDDLLIASLGQSAGSSETDRGIPIANSSLRLGIATSDYMIVFSRNIWLLLVLTLLFVAAGFGALWLRQVGMERGMAVLRSGKRVEPEGMTLAETLRQQDETPEAASPRRAVVDTQARAPEKSLGLDRSIFRAYDIRGVLGHTLNAEIAKLIGRAIGSEARERGLREIVVGRDGRLSGPDLSAGLIEGLRSAGCHVLDIGLAATPLTYFAAYHFNAGSCISVTGSHNPPDYNGFKIVLGGVTLAESAITDLYTRIIENRFVDGANEGSVQRMEVEAEYVSRISDDIQVEQPLKVVIDCGNGVAGAIAPAVLEGIGCEVIQLYCDVDGEFPNHHPDPSDPDNLRDLILMVKQTGADLGLAFDGDGDRLGVVTASGEIVYPDRVLMLFAMDVLSRNPGATIIYDVKCTGHLQPVILQHGGSPVMWRTGHSLIKAKMRETDAQLAGEMSGHFFFAERWFGFDDGVYAAARLLEILGADAEGRGVQEIFDSLPNGVSTPELKIPLPEGEHYRFMERFCEQVRLDGARLTLIDGVRADWPDGWGLVRASNTTPVLVLRFDADNAAALERIQNVFREQLLLIDPALVLPF